MVKRSQNMKSQLTCKKTGILCWRLIIASFSQAIFSHIFSLFLKCQTGCFKIGHLVAILIFLKWPDVHIKEEKTKLKPNKNFLSSLLGVLN